MCVDEKKVIGQGTHDRVIIDKAALRDGGC
jgi:predicted thioesterase